MYFTHHLRYHNIPHGLNEHGYAVMDEGTQVCLLKKGIKTFFFEVPMAVKNLSYDKYGHYFHAVVAYLGPLIKEHYMNTKVAGGPWIAAMSTTIIGGSRVGGVGWGAGSGNRKEPKKYGPGFLDKIVDLVYSKDEYAQFSK